MNYLVARGVPEERLSAQGLGAQKPLVDNGTEAGRAKNRRVEFVFVR
jgi:outer membrane protein OmpA-like peptidoglycan-associated protein